MVSPLTRLARSEGRSSRDAFRFDIDQHILAIFLLWASRPRDAEPDETGRYFIGECGEVPERTFERWSPYSIAERLDE
jgi:hypothetical protein